MGTTDDSGSHQPSLPTPALTLPFVGICPNRTASSRIRPHRRRADRQLPASRHRWSRTGGEFRTPKPKAALAKALSRRQPRARSIIFRIEFRIFISP